MRASCCVQMEICTQYTTQRINGRSSFVATICFTTCHSPIPEHKPEIPLTGDQLVGFNNESFHSPIFHLRTD